MMMDPVYDDGSGVIEELEASRRQHRCRTALPWRTSAMGQVRPPYYNRTVQERRRRALHEDWTGCAEKKNPAKDRTLTGSSIGPDWSEKEDSNLRPLRPERFDCTSINSVIRPLGASFGLPLSRTTSSICSTARSVEQSGTVAHGEPPRRSAIGPRTCRARTAAAAAGQRRAAVPDPADPGRAEGRPRRPRRPRGPG